MSSLRSKILAGRFQVFMNLPEEQVEQQKLTAQLTVRELRSRDVILVNAQKVYDSVFSDLITGALDINDTEYSSIPRPKPPYHSMWIEAAQKFHEAGDVRVGMLSLTVDRKLLPAGWTSDIPEVEERFARDLPPKVVIALIWIDAHGVPVCAGKITYWTDAEGNFQYSFRVPGLCWMAEDHRQRQEHIIAFLRAQQLWFLFTMARLNCHNAELRPIESGQGRLKRTRRSRPPASVWHEIVVKPSLLVKRLRTANPTEAEKHAVRLHKVRGHFADYTKGAGLFGKWKVLIWIDEHEAGDEALGTVVASYRVE